MSVRRSWSPVVMLSVLVLVALQLSVPVALRLVPRAAAAVAQPGTFHLSVLEALDASHGSKPTDTPKPISTFKWLISAEKTNGAYGYAGSTTGGQPGYDAVGDPTNNATTFAQCTPGTRTSASDPGPNVTSGKYDPRGCQWPSTRYTPGAVPVVAEGDQSDLTAGVPNNLTLQPGRYLISVTADGHKIDGAHFDVDGTKGTPDVVVSMHATPVPLGTLRLRVFKDTAPVDGTYEVGTEKPLKGFTVHLNDVMGEVTTDYFGNRLCTNYLHVDATNIATYTGQKIGAVAFDAAGLPVVDAANAGGTCLSAANGDVVIPNIGPNRYTASVVAPSGQKWYQTTTLEGNHDWDMWIAEAETGFDTEQTVGGEPVPPVDMGFVPYNPVAGQLDSAPAAMTGTGTITGTAVVINAYVGGVGGTTVIGGNMTPNAGVAGANIRGPVDSPIITLSDLGSNDQMIYVGRGAADGTFTITNVPDGDYQLTVWDYAQDLILDSFNVTVHTGETVDVGQKGLVGWWTTITGTVFIDTNANGRRDPGEVGVPKFPIGVKHRDNSVLDAGQSAASTDDKGSYTITEGYPISKWFVVEAFNTGYKTTGITVQADNEPSSRTYTGAAVDVNVLPIIGLSGRLDWGVQRYSGGENGGIAGTVSYDTTRNELDPTYAVTEPYQPGIPGLTTHLYYPLRDAAGTVLIDPATGGARLMTGTDGKPLDLADPYVTETWDQSAGCTNRMHDGTPLTDQNALPPVGDSAYPCVEAPMAGWHAVPSDQTDGAFGQTVNGNYAFAQVNYDNSAIAAEADRQAAAVAASLDPTPTTPMSALAAPVPMANDDYVVKVDIPTLSNNKPLYKPTQEEDVNVFDGDTRLPQENFPVAAGDPLPSGAQSPGDGGLLSQGGGFVSPCIGNGHTVNVTDAPFQANGGSPYEGQSRHLCDQKLVTVRGGQAAAPNFNLFTPVPLPTHFWGLTINDLGLSQDKSQIGYGEAQPLPNVPMGIYDWSGRLVDTVTTDWNGFYEALEPSTSSYNCPLPAGPCPGMYYFKGNDPGQPGHVNTNYNPRFRTIGTQFQAWPGLWTVTDTAPTQVGVIAVAPGTSQTNPVQCDLNAGAAGDVTKMAPDLMSVSQPYVNATKKAPAQGSVVNKAITRTLAGVTTVTLGLSGVANVAAGQTVSVTGVGVPYDVTGVTTVGKPASIGTTISNPSVSYRITSSAAAPVTPASGAVTVSTTLVNVPNTQQITLTGEGFGAGSTVTLTPAVGAATPITPSAASANSLTFTVDRATLTTAGPYQLGVVSGASSLASVNGLTLHLLGTGYSPKLIQVNAPAANQIDSSNQSTATSPRLNLPSAAFPAVTSGDPNTTPEDVLQKAVDLASGSNQALVVVWPNAAARDNPRGDYYENLIIHSNVKVQGVGAGGSYLDAAGKQVDVAGSRINGLGFNPDNAAGAAWVAKMSSVPHDGPQNVPDAAVVTVLGRGTGFTAGYKGALDGFTVTGGSQVDFVTNINVVSGGTKTPAGAPGALITQGGGIYLHASANNMQVTNDVVIGNSGSYAGGIRVGTPYTAVETSPNIWSTATSHNTGVTISHNRIRDNGGTNLAGGIGMFDGSDGYSVDHNDLCGNFSAEYGGGLTHYGLSPRGKVTANRVYLNASYDEGGGMMLAGELNPNLSEPSAGAGANIDIDANLVQDNLANDDGGGIRLLQVGNKELDLTNNIVTDNISAHEGGGLALDDSTNVHITGNTVMKNITTATAITSNGQPAPAGLSTASNSDQLQATLGRNAPLYSQPKDFRDNIFSDNRAGTWDPTTGLVTGIGAAGDTAAVRRWDMGSVDTVSPLLAPTYSLLSQADPQVTSSSTNVVGVSPGVSNPYDVSVQILTSRAFPSFRQAVIVANAVSPVIQGNYHLAAGSVAHNAGGTVSSTLGSPDRVSLDALRLLGHDYDGQTRSNTAVDPLDIGADEAP